MGDVQGFLKYDRDKKSMQAPQERVHHCPARLLQVHSLGAICAPGNEG